MSTQILDKSSKGALGGTTRARRLSRNASGLDSRHRNHDGVRTRAKSSVMKKTVPVRNQLHDRPRGQSSTLIASDSSVLSQLCNKNLEFWLLLFRQPSWPSDWTAHSDLSVLCSRDASPMTDAEHAIVEANSAMDINVDVTVGGEEATASRVNAMDDVNQNFFAPANENEDIEIAMEPAESECGFGDSMVSPPMNEDKGRLEIQRFMLNQERDKLLLWKCSFDDKDLHTLMSDKEMRNNVGNSILESMVDIGEAVLGVAKPPSLHMSGEGVGGECEEGKLYVEGLELVHLVQRGKQWAKQVGGDGNDNDTVIANLTEEAADTGGVILLNRLKANIKRIQKLSFPIRLALGDMEG